MRIKLRRESECRRRDARQKEQISHLSFGQEDRSSAEMESLSREPHRVRPAGICSETDVEKVCRCVTVDRRSPAQMCEESRGPNTVVKGCQRNEGRHGTRTGVL